MENVVYNITYQEGMKISLQKGNEKLGKGVYTFNLMPGDQPLATHTRGKLTNIKGTCGGVCQGCEICCYAIRDARLHHNAVIPSVGKNTVIMRNDLNDLFMQLKNALINKKAHILRLHSSGEFESYEHLLCMVKLAKALPDVKIYSYTKRFSFVDKYLKENGMFPDNFILNISVWNNNDKGYNFEGLNKFIFDDGNDTSLNNLVHCPAVKPDGGRTNVTCSTCGRCYRKNAGLITCVYSH